MSTTEPISTADQLYRAPDLGRCELLQGRLVMMSPAGAQHGQIVVNITAPLAVFVKQKGLGKVLGAETGFVLGREPDTVRAPDVAFVAAARIPGRVDPGFFEGAPDLAVEVLSPEDRPKEVLAKVRQWLDAGARAVWVVDPRTRSAAVHDSRGETRLLALGDALRGEDIVPGFSLPLSEVFAD